MNGDPDTTRGQRPDPGHIWRTWLVTGSRAHPIDRRRLQGAHRGLKQLLAEGGEGEVLRRPWRDFSRAMVRQSVNDAMGRLTPRERVVVTMAYFAGFSNEEISGELGMTVRGVQRSLRRALDRLSDALERARRIALAILAGAATGRLGRWLSDTLTPAGVHVVAAAVVIGVVVAAPAPAASASRPSAPTTHAAAVAPAAPAPQPGQATAPVAGSVTLPAVSVTTAPSVSVPVALPPVPKVKLPRVSVPKAL